MDAAFPLGCHLKPHGRNLSARPPSPGRPSALPEAHAPMCRAAWAGPGPSSLSCSRPLYVALNQEQRPQDLREGRASPKPRTLQRGLKDQPGPHGGLPCTPRRPHQPPPHSHPPPGPGGPTTGSHGPASHTRPGSSGRGTGCSLTTWGQEAAGGHQLPPPCGQRDFRVLPRTRETRRDAPGCAHPQQVSPPGQKASWNTAHTRTSTWPPGSPRFQSVVRESGGPGAGPSPVVWGPRPHPG